MSDDKSKKNNKENKEENTEEENKEESVDFTFDIEISNDYYQAYLIVEIIKEDCIIDSSRIEEFLDEKNITSGIDYLIIEKISNKPESGRFLIAEGEKHINGEDAKIKYLFDTNNKLHPEENKDGSVDYKKMHLLQKVEKDQVLAEKTEIVKGKNGNTVTGKEIFSKKGKDVNFKFGKNIKLSDDGLKMISDIDGAISFNNDKAFIEEILELNEGVGVATGNIEFHGKVLITGIVENGYKVVASDDIVVNGIVEGATLISDGSIEISKGIQGNDHAYIKCKGDFKTRFVNSSKLEVDGDINLDIIMHSQVASNGKLTAVGKKGTVVGGNYSIKKGIDAKIIGSEMGTITTLKVGIDNKLLLKYKESNEIVKKYSVEVRELTKDIKTMKKKVESGNRNTFLVDKYKAALEKIQVMRPELDQAKQDVKEIRKKFAELQGSKIVVSEIFPGTKINITNSFYNIKDRLNRVTIRKEGGEVKIIER